MKQQDNQSYDQKTGSADREVTGTKKGMPGGEIGRGSTASGNADYGGSEGNSPERKTSRNGSDSNAA